MEKNVKPALNGKVLDTIKIVASFMVIFVHCNVTTSWPMLDFFINNVLCRTAVPFFFITSAYYIRKKAVASEGYLKKKLGQLFMNYLFWSAIFLPAGLNWIQQNMEIDYALYPFALLFGLFYSGTYYHLWYIPALMFALWFVSFLLKRFSGKIVFVISALLYLFGSLETYYGLIADEGLKRLFDTYIQLFFTTRNGLFFAMIFVAIGFFIHDHLPKILKLKKYFAPLLFFSGILVILEGIAVSTIQSLDNNFMLSLIPFSFLLFAVGLTSKTCIKMEMGKLRELSNFYYFIHPICVIILFELSNSFQLGFFQDSIIGFLLACLFTHALSLLLFQLKKNEIRKSALLTSFFLGLVCTAFYRGAVLVFENPAFPPQFELTHCLLIFFMITLTAFMSRLQQKKNEKLLLE